MWISSIFQATEVYTSLIPLLVTQFFTPAPDHLSKKTPASFFLARILSVHVVKIGQFCLTHVEWWSPPLCCVNLKHESKFLLCLKFCRQGYPKSGENIFFSFVYSWKLSKFNSDGCTPFWRHWTIHPFHPRRSGNSLIHTCAHCSIPGTHWTLTHFALAQTQRKCKLISSVRGRKETEKFEMSLS